MNKTPNQKLQFLEDGGRVRRYHTLDVVRPQTVAEHVYGVLSILTVLRGENVSQNLFFAALLHDAPESITGDIPAPTKRELRKRFPGTDFVNDWELEIFVEHWGEGAVQRFNDLTEAEARHLKMADILEGLRYCEREYRLGNTDIVPVARRYAAYLENFELTKSEINLAEYIAPDFISKVTWKTLPKEEK